MALATACLLVAGLVGTVLLVPVHPEYGLLSLLSRAMPRGALAGGTPTWWTFEDIGNIALFVPVGLVAATRLRVPLALLAGAALSAACETAQLWIPERHASVSDVLLNVVGVALGVLSITLLRRRSRRRQTSETNPHSVQAQ